MKDMEKSGSELDLPGFRFHPTEEELLEFYLRRAAAGKKLNFDIIGTLNLYLYDPWDLPSLAKMGEREWYFFVPRDRRQANGGRPNRTTERGFWKATGSDRPIRSAANPRRLIGLKKTLVYYRGRAPRGTKTDWVMNEYRLPDSLHSSFSSPQQPKEDIVLCKIYRKATTMKELEHRAALEEESKAASQGCTLSADSSDQETFQRFSNEDELIMEMKVEFDQVAPTEMQNEANEVTSANSISPARPPVDSIVPVAAGRPPVSPKPPTVGLLQSPPPELQAVRQLPSLPALQVPNHMTFGWGQDTFLGQLRSPWLDQWSPLYASLLNF